jgi:hypothetical protein
MVGKQEVIRSFLFAVVRADCLSSAITPVTIAYGLAS